MGVRNGKERTVKPQVPGRDENPTAVVGLTAIGQFRGTTQDAGFDTGSTTAREMRPGAR